MQITPDGVEYWQNVCTALGRFPNIEVVTLSSQWCSFMHGIKNHVKASTYGELFPQSSPLARSWSLHHLRPLPWACSRDRHGPPMTDNGSTEFTILTRLTRALEIFAPLDTDPKKFCSYQQLAELDLCIDMHVDAGLPMYYCLDCTLSLLRGARLPKRLKLALPSESKKGHNPNPVFPIDQVFPANPATIWAHMVSFDIVHLKVDPDNLGNLLVGSMPNLNSLYFGNIELTSGTWQDTISFMHRSMALKRFVIDPGWSPEVGRGLLYPNHRVVWSKDELVVDSHEVKFVAQEHEDFMKAIGHYVVHGGQHPMIDAPLSQEASDSPLPESWRRRRPVADPR
ncbi:MAG: hypothetical protein LQ352_004613 [Teloschistes flavicans]|nr:MAG: hypothetical protein LQ352_004613 [Teloschistes flavicans]